MTSRPEPPGPENPLTRLGRWLFVDRSTDRIVVAQWPNWSLWLFIAATAVGFLIPAGRWSLIVAIIGVVALVIWALDEILRGCNPFRRILGALVLVIVAIRWLPR